MVAQILIADDDSVVRDFLSEYLSSLKHRVIVVEDGFQLSQKAVEHRPHLIVTDIQMPGAYGSSVYQILQRDPKTASIPILFISGHSQEKLKKVLPVDNKTRFIQKPVPLEALDRAIRELLPMGGYTP